MGASGSMEPFLGDCERCGRPAAPIMFCPSCEASSCAFCPGADGQVPSDDLDPDDASMECPACRAGRTIVYQG
jgi:hypothetical protein